MLNPSEMHQYCNKYGFFSEKWPEVCLWRWASEGVWLLSDWEQWVWLSGVGGKVRCEWM